MFDSEFQSVRTRAWVSAEVTYSLHPLWMRIAHWHSDIISGGGTMATPPTNARVNRTTKLRECTAGKRGNDLISCLLENYELLSEVVPPRKKPKSCECVRVFPDSHCTLVCLDCGRTHGQTSDGVAAQQWGHYSAPVKIHQYRRVTRLREVLRNMQGDGSAPLCVEATKLIKTMRAARMKPSIRRMKLVLKRSGLGKYIEQAPRFCGLIDPGFKSVQFGRGVERKIESMFRRCDSVWGKVTDDLKAVGWMRKNFSSYIFVIYQLLVLLGENATASQVEEYLLKSDDLGKKQQYIWKLFCKHLGWEYNQYYGNVIQENPRTRSPSKGPRTILGFLRQLNIGHTAPAVGTRPPRD